MAANLQGQSATEQGGFQSSAGPLPDPLVPSQERKKKGTNGKPGENNTKTMDRLTRPKLQNQSSKTGTDNINQGHTYQMYNMITETKLQFKIKKHGYLVTYMEEKAGSV